VIHSDRPTWRVAIVVTALFIVAVGMLFVLVGSGAIGHGTVVVNGRSLVWLGLAEVAVGGAILVWMRWRFRPSGAESDGWSALTSALVDWNLRDDGLTRSKRGGALVLVSALGLFLELVLIRMLGAEIKVFAFLKNVVLLGAFLGLGLGFFMARRREGWLPLLLPALALLIVSVVLGSEFGLTTTTVMPGSDELVLLGLGADPRLGVPLVLLLLSWLPYYAITLVYFVSVIFVFIPLGQYTGKCMRAFPPLRAYSLNLLGALGGTLLFAAVSFAWLPPSVWCGVTALAGLPLVLRRRSAPSALSLKRLQRANLAAAVVVIAINFLPASAVWSPYNKLVVEPLRSVDQKGDPFLWGYQLGVGEYYYQDMADLSATFFGAHPNLPLEYRYSEYEVPYAFIRPSNVLILGAGSGNDVAAALRHGAERVDAVDIDPGILDFGRRLHPERPYASARVTRHANDARNFLKRTDRAYDLVLFGLLDSQQVLSAFGSVRLDNFVYTVQGMRDAFARVKPGGLLVVTFELFRPWIGERIARVLREATGQTALVLHAHHGTVFLLRKDGSIGATEVQAALSKMGGVVKPVSLASTGTRATTDDWPYLYLREPSLPLAYWTMLPLLALVAVKVSRGILGTGWRIQWRFFWLGAAFMLMEVRIIAQVALLFGSTWLVNAAAIAAVLAMAILANLLAAVLRSSTIYLWAILLLVTLALSSLLHQTVFLGLGQLSGGAAGALLLALPIFFAGMVFSTSLRSVREVDAAMASNLIGAILGGLLEYLSLVLGIASLAWFAGLLYLLALVSRSPEPNATSP
jgi:hypothetical protein